MAPSDKRPPYSIPIVRGPIGRAATDPATNADAEDLITPERLAKGDLQVARGAGGRVRLAIPAGLTIVKELVRRGVFPYHYEIYGVGFLELQNAFRAPWAPRSGAVLMEQWGVGVSAGAANEIYELVYRKIGTSRVIIVEQVVTYPKEYEERSRHKDYESAFEALCAAMDEERERANNV